MKVTLEIPNSSRALHIVVLFENDRGTETLSSSSFSPVVDGLVLRRDNSFGGCIEEVLPDAGTE